MAVEALPKAGRSWDAGAVLRNVTAGSLSAAIGLASACSFAAMIFSGPFAGDLGRGVTVMLITAVVIGFALAWKSGFPHAIGGPDINATALFSLIAGSIAPLGAVLPQDQRFAVLMTILALSSAVVGLVLLGIGWQRMARIIRFVPYPVAGGFMAATGWLVVAGAVRVAADVPLSWGGLSALLTPNALGELAALAALVAIGFLASARWKSPYVLPLVLLGGVVAVHGALVYAGLSIDQAQSMGILLEVVDNSGWWTPQDYHSIALDGRVLLKPLGDVAALVVVVALAILMNGTGAELDSRVEADLDHELRVHGSAILASAALGGLAGNMSLSRTTLNRAAGGVSRLSGLTVVALLGAVLVLGMDLVGLLPRVVLAALLAHAGLRLVWNWAFANTRLLPWGDRLTILAIVVLAANFGFLPALGFGVLAGCVIFVLDVSRVDIVRHVFGANEFPSTLMRGDADMAVLAKQGGRIQVVVLHSFIFFGSAHRLYERIRGLLESKQPMMVILDMTDVTGVDSSAGAGFLKIADALRDAGVQQVIAGGSRPVLDRLEATGALGDDIGLYKTLDEALEEAENMVLGASAPEDAPSESMIGWLGRALRDEEKGRRLAGYLRRLKLGQWSYLCRAGDDTDAMHFVESGRISILLEREGHPPLRVRGIGRNVVVGEMGFFLNQPRSASLRTDEDTVLWALDHAAWERLQAEAPEVVSALQAYLVRLQSERLAFANRQIAALQR